MSTSAHRQVDPVIKAVKKKFPRVKLGKPSPKKCKTELMEEVIIAVLRSLWVAVDVAPDVRLGVLLKALSTTKRDSLFSLCALASSGMTGEDIPLQQVSACMLQRGFTDDVLKQFSPLAEVKGNSLTFVHPMIGSFLAALHFIIYPGVSAAKSLTRDLLRPTHGGFVLSENVSNTIQFFCGLSSSGISSLAGVSTKQIFGTLCLHVDGSRPVEEKLNVGLALLMIKCAYEARNSDLCGMIDRECLKARTLVVDCKEVDASSLGYYINHTTQQESYWTVYCRDRTVTDALRAEVKDLLVKSEKHLPKGVLILSNRTEEYLNSTVRVLLSPGKQPLINMDEKAESFSPYGYQTFGQYESNQRMETSVSFNHVKDALLPSLQVHSSVTSVDGQYRRMDHVWFNVPRTMRTDFYEHFDVSPLVPIHWVKVKDPDGSKELESKYLDLAQHQEDAAAGAQAVEMVILNSQLPCLLQVREPDSNECQTISLCSQSDTSVDHGSIGCDYLKPEFLAPQDSVITWRKSEPFDSAADKRIDRDLPLPSNKLRLGDSAIVVRSNSLTLREELLHRHKPPERAMSEAEKMEVSEHKVQQAAMEAFDFPGVCFFSNDADFNEGETYSLPDFLSSCSVLREGGSGTIMEVKYDGKPYTVKKTAFRLKKVSMVAKLRHKNLLKLTAMLMGKSVKQDSTSRDVFLFSPKLTGDLGRLVGSFEHNCLSSLMERFAGEKLILVKIRDNFCHVAREILSALDYLHTCPSPIVHGNVKATNVLVRMHCNCRNPLVCVCRRQPEIVLGEFDSGLELDKEGNLLPDPPKESALGYYSPASSVYHVSAVGTDGYRSPEESMCVVGNDLAIMPPVTVKADIFSFGLLMLLLFGNKEGPKSQRQMATLLLSMNQTVSPSQSLTEEQQEVLKNSGFSTLRKREVHVGENDLHRVLPVSSLKREFAGDSHLLDFISRCLAVDPKRRFNASDLLQHEFLALSSHT